MSDKKGQIKATRDGRLYKKNSDFFSDEKVQKIVTGLIGSRIHKEIRNNRKGNDGQFGERVITTT